jgi:undecaprenyl diphosphate synthase
MIAMNLDKYKHQILEHGNLPKHVAIIMDGNGRWAKKNGALRVFGHREGVKSVRVITELAGELGIKELTLYTFSSENWNRPKMEVSALMNLLVETIKGEVDDLNKNNVRLTVIGKLHDLPKGPQKSLLNAIESTSKNTGLNLNLAISYSSREEILHAVKQINKDVLENKINPEDITLDMISDNLYTKGMHDPDLLIRTSGEFRLSNFLLYQLAYTEIYLTNEYWPEFREMSFLKALENYQSRERRYGKVSEQINS